MKSSLWDSSTSLELGTPTVARLGQPTEVAGEWRAPLPSTPTRCSGCRGSFPSRAPKEGSQRGAVTTLCTWRRSSSCCRAAQQEKPAELAGREPSAGGGWYGGLARLGAARAHGEAARGAANVLLGSISTFTGQPLVGRADGATRRARAERDQIKKKNTSNDKAQMSKIQKKPLSALSSLYSTYTQYSIVTLY